MRYEIPAGENIYDHARTMALLANTFRREVVAEFNGVLITAKPGGRMYDVIREWDRANQIRFFGEVVYDE